MDHSGGLASLGTNVKDDSLSHVTIGGGCTGGFLTSPSKCLSPSLTLHDSAYTVPEQYTMHVTDAVFHASSAGDHFGFAFQGGTASSHAQTGCCNQLSNNENGRCKTWESPPRCEGPNPSPNLNRNHRLGVKAQSDAAS